MNKYIKINENNEIVDVFFTFQKNKFDGTEIIIEENVPSPYKHKINGKSISNEYGFWIFKFIESVVVEKTNSEIEIEVNTYYLPVYIEKRLLELRQLMYTRWVDSSKTGAANQAQYKIAKTNMAGSTSLSEVDTEYNNFELFMNLS